MIFYCNAQVPANKQGLYCPPLTLSITALINLAISVLYSFIFTTILFSISHSSYPHPPSPLLSSLFFIPLLYDFMHFVIAVILFSLFILLQFELLSLITMIVV